MHEPGRGKPTRLASMDKNCTDRLFIKNTFLCEIIYKKLTRKSLKLELMMMHRIVESMIRTISARELRDRIIGHLRVRVLDVMRRGDQQHWLQVQRLPRT
jgi:hypothetical protein